MTSLMRKTALKLKPRTPKIVNQLHLKLLNKKLDSFKPKVRFSIESHGYIIKTAEHPKELREVLKLRYDVFTKEYGVKMKFEDIDFDRFDLLGDHILVISKDTHKILATYRVMSTLFTDTFYSENEFMIANFLKQPGVKMELGRAAVHESFRTGALINLVWKGLARFAQLTKAEHMFGCTSVETEDPMVAMSIFKSLQEKHFTAQFFVQPVKKYRFPEYPELIDAELLAKAQDQIPSLFKSYLKAGARIHAVPAWDRDFHCVDFFTSLELKNLDAAYLRRYFGVHADSDSAD